MKLICSVWHIPIQMLIACRQQMRWHTVIIITDKLEIFIFCRQRPASLTFQLFSWDFHVYYQYSRLPYWGLGPRILFGFTASLFCCHYHYRHHQLNCLIVFILYESYCFTEASTLNVKALTGCDQLILEYLWKDITHRVFYCLIQGGCLISTTQVPVLRLCVPVFFHQVM